MRVVNAKAAAGAVWHRVEARVRVFDKIWPVGICVTDIDQTPRSGGYIVPMQRYQTMRQGARTGAVAPCALCVGILCLTAAAGMVEAGEIYKSIDANGNVVYSDHLDPSMTRSTTVQLDDTRPAPRELHFCWTNCFTLVLDNGAYRRIDGIDESWTVETFSDKAIVLHRHDAPVDWNGYSRDVVYAGQVSHDRLIGVTVNGKPTSGIDASWGTALNTLPGNNAERDAKGSPNPDTSGVALSSALMPPPVPDEDQPPLPEDGLLWTPGYWNWRDQGYVWVPGAWVRPPRLGLLWTPAYWGPAGTVFVFHPGHWGSTVGFYGGVNYGHGYVGNGYTGGRWIGNSFAYDNTVNHVNPKSGANQGPRRAAKRRRPPSRPKGRPPPSRRRFRTRLPKSNTSLRPKPRRPDRPSFRDRNIGPPSVDGHPPFSVGPAPENIDSLALIGGDCTRFLVDILRFVRVALKGPAAADGEIRHQRLDIVAVDCRHIRTMRGRLDGLRVW